MPEVGGGASFDSAYVTWVETFTCLVWPGLVSLVLQLKRYGPGVSAEADSAIDLNQATYILAFRYEIRHISAHQSAIDAFLLFEAILFLQCHPMFHLAVTEF